MNQFIPRNTFWFQSRYYNKSKVNLKDGEIIDILRYYYPEIEIENEKFIYKKKCILWDKDVDIDTAISTIKKNCKDGNKNVSIYDAYNYYCKMFKCKLERLFNELNLSNSVELKVTLL